MFRSLSFRIFSAAFALPALVLLGCGGGSVNAEAKASASTEDGASAKASADHSWDYADSEGDTDSVESAETAPKVGEATKQSASASPRSAPPPAAPTKQPTLLGARRDLILTQGASASCQCLGVHVGMPSDKEFTWNGPAPEVDAGSQLVVALGSEGIPCAKSATGASYQGYRRDGENIVISIEAAHPGRPITHGAIIPRPNGQGRIFLEPVGKIPYGRGPSGEGRCAVPAPAR